MLSTLAHEFGHGVGALLVGGPFDRLVVYADGSGVAATATSGGRIARAVVAPGGLVGPAVAAAGMRLRARTQRQARVALAVTAGLLLLTLLLVLRNLFGIAFVLAVAAALSAIVCRGQGWVPRFTLVFLAVQLALSVFSRSDYLFTSVARTGAGPMPSDLPAGGIGAGSIAWRLSRYRHVSIVSLVCSLTPHLKPNDNSHSRNAPVGNVARRMQPHNL